jgi:hypothetical protein
MSAHPPSSCMPRSKATIGELTLLATPLRTATTCRLEETCARAISGHAAAEPAKSVTKLWRQGILST